MAPRKVDMNAETVFGQRMVGAAEGGTAAAGEIGATPTAQSLIRMWLVDQFATLLTANCGADDRFSVVCQRFGRGRPPKTMVCPPPN
jgi:hypothetical protein